MSELRKIMVCQSMVCQDKGSKGVLHRLQTVYNDKFMDTYPDLRIEVGDCNGGCEQGPIVKVNDSVMLRQVDNQTAQQLLEDPESVMGDVMHVLQEDRDTFERIIDGGLY